VGIVLFSLISLGATGCGTPAAGTANTSNVSSAFQGVQNTALAAGNKRRLSKTNKSAKKPGGITNVPLPRRKPVRTPDYTNTYPKNANLPARDRSGTINERLRRAGYPQGNSNDFASGLKNSLKGRASSPSSFRSPPTRKASYKAATARYMADIDALKSLPKAQRSKAQRVAVRKYQAARKKIRIQFKHK
jgi:hypothetical protein